MKIIEHSKPSIGQEELEKVSEVIKSGYLAQDTNDIKYGYPIYDKNYRLARERIIDSLVKNNIIPCGRYGSWRYFSMEDAILDGKRAADFILRDA